MKEAKNNKQFNVNRIVATEENTAVGKRTKAQQKRIDAFNKTMNAKNPKKN